MREEPFFRLDERFDVDFFLVDEERFDVDFFRDDDFFAVDLFRLDPFFAVDFFAVDFRLDDFFRLDLRGTLAPSSRASESPIAIACLRLVTLRPLPLFSVPRFRSCIARATFLLALRPYFRPLDFFAAMCPPVDW